MKDLLTAVRDRDLATIKCLYKDGVTLMKRSVRGETAIMVAAMK
jgi:hypothetical protein